MPPTLRPSPSSISITLRRQYVLPAPGRPVIPIFSAAPMPRTDPINMHRAIKTLFVFVGNPRELPPLAPALGRRPPAFAGGPPARPKSAVWRCPLGTQRGPFPDIRPPSAQVGCGDGTGPVGTG